MRLAIFIPNRHRRSQGFGWMVINLSPNYVGLINFDEASSRQARKGLAGQTEGRR